MLLPRYHHKLVNCGEKVMAFGGFASTLKI